MRYSQKDVALNLGLASSRLGDLGLDFISRPQVPRLELRDNDSDDCGGYCDS